MKFRLVYQGELPAKRSGGHPELLRVKHAIRQKIHYQLRDLVKRDSSLWVLTENIRGNVPSLPFSGGVKAVGSDFWPDFSAIGARGRIAEFEFVPLIIGELPAVCELDILFLRREPPGSLITKSRDVYGGDLDNRLKLFFDVLRVPQDANEIPPGLVPDSREQPFFCLVEDDSLITKYQVESDTLLGDAAEGTRPTDIKLVIGVTMRVTRVTAYNSRFTALL